MKTLITNSLSRGATNVTNMATSVSDSTPRTGSSIGQLFDLCGITREHTIYDQNYRFHHSKIKAGQCVHASGDECKAVHLVFSGFLKNTWTDKDGTEKVINFPMKNELVGLDAIAPRKYTNTLTALSDCELITIPIEFLNRHEIASEILKLHLITEMSKQLVNEQKILFVTSCLPADARVAKFLLSLSFKFKTLGFSEKSFLLRMKQEDIGSHLGLTNETVSRTLSALCDLGLMKKNNRQIDILDFDALMKFRRLPANMNYSRRQDKSVHCS